MLQECLKGTDESKSSDVRAFRVVRCEFVVFVRHKLIWFPDAFVPAWSIDVGDTVRGRQLKPLRVLKLLRILKALPLLRYAIWVGSKFYRVYTFGTVMRNEYSFHVARTVSIGRRLEDEMSYWLNPVFIKFMRVFINLAFSIHLSCCAYWRVKVVRNTW